MPAVKILFPFAVCRKGFGNNGKIKGNHVPFVKIEMADCRYNSILGNHKYLSILKKPIIMRGRFNLNHLAVLLISVFVITTGCNKEPAEDQTTVTDYDGNVYNIVKIGNQEWLDRNLAVTHYRNGDPVTNVLATTGDEGGWINYNNDPATGEVYGKLYNSQAVLDPRGLAPEGWHVATRQEWLDLVNFLGGFDVAGGKLKEMGTSHWDAPNSGATDDYGFSALPGGYASGASYYLGRYAGFWSSTIVEQSPTGTYMFYLYADNPTVQEDWSTPMGFSVRCVRD